MLEDHVGTNDPGVVDRYVFARNTVVCILRRETVTEVVAVIDVIREISDMSKDAVTLIELMIDPDIKAVVIVGIRSVREKVIQIAAADSCLVRERIQIH